MCLSTHTKLPLAFSGTSHLLLAQYPSILTEFSFSRRVWYKYVVPREQASKLLAVSLSTLQCRTLEQWLHSNANLAPYPPITIRAIITSSLPSKNREKQERKKNFNIL